MLTATVEVSSRLSKPSSNRHSSTHPFPSRVTSLALPERPPAQSQSRPRTALRSKRGPPRSPRSVPRDNRNGRPRTSGRRNGMARSLPHWPPADLPSHLAGCWGFIYAVDWWCQRGRLLPSGHAGAVFRLLVSDFADAVCVRFYAVVVLVSLRVHHDRTVRTSMDDALWCV